MYTTLKHQTQIHFFFFLNEMQTQMGNENFIIYLTHFTFGSLIKHQSDYTLKDNMLFNETLKKKKIIRGIIDES